MTIKVEFENTDTFGGEANYCWVNRVEREFPDGTSDLAIVRAAKAWAGYNGLRCRKDNFGDSVALYPQGICQVLFINDVY